jgi:PPOX class probable F420-dependent enzyme
MPKPPLPDELLAVLAKPNPAIIGSVQPNGAPNTVATWYLWEDGRALVNMAAGRKRLDFLRREPRVSLTVLDEASWYRHITLHGEISLSDDPELADIDRLCTHYLGSAYSNRVEPRVSGWIEVETWHAWNGGRPWGY